MIESAFTLNIVAWTPPGVAAIPLRRRDGSVRAWAWVDEADREWAVQWPWSMNSHGYVHRRLANSGRSGRHVRLHREILGLSRGHERGVTPSDGEVDHINGNRLDNRRANLRVVTRQQNLHNTRSRGGGSKHAGVGWDASRRRWRAQVTFDYRNHFLGRFAREEDAIAAVNEFRRSVGMA